MAEVDLTSKKVQKLKKTDLSNISEAGLLFVFPTFTVLNQQKKKKGKREKNGPKPKSGHPVWSVHSYNPFGNTCKYFLWPAAGENCARSGFTGAQITAPHFQDFGSCRF